MSTHTDGSGNEIADALSSAAEAAVAGESTDGQTLTEIIWSLVMTLLEYAESFAMSLLRPWVAYQLGMALAVFVLALVLRRWLGPQIRNWMGTREGWPKWRMRVLVVVHQRLRAIFFVILIWILVWIMREATWPSRSYVLGLIATLATAWLLVALATRLIRSMFLRRAVRYGAWIYVTLYVLGIVDETSQVLDAAAFSLGDMRISALLIVQGIVIVGFLIALARFVTVTTSSRVQANEDISPSMRVLIVKAVQIVFYAIAFYAGVRALGIDPEGIGCAVGGHWCGPWFRSAEGRIEPCVGGDHPAR